MSKCDREWNILLPQFIWHTCRLGAPPNNSLNMYVSTGWWKLVTFDWCFWRYQNVWPSLWNWRTGRKNCVKWNYWKRSKSRKVWQRAICSGFILFDILFYSKSSEEIAEIKRSSSIKVPLQKSYYFADRGAIILKWNGC